MREIKFRAWDKKSKRWLYVTLKSLSECVGVSEYAVADTPEDLFYTAKYKTQFTGLEDKNGKEIYEGDIVEETLVTKKGYVWRTGKVQKEDLTIKNKVVVKDITNLPTIVYCHDIIEVIGNIYENSEKVR